MRRFLLGLTSAVLLLAACGIPDETDVRVDGKGPVSDTGAAEQSGRPPPERRASGYDVDEFAANFLTAAAGQASEAYQRVNDYILPERRLKPKQANEVAINIVRLAEAPLITRNNDGTSQVKLERVQQVGVLRPNGVVDEPMATERSYEFTVGVAPGDTGKPAPNDGLYVRDPPPVLLITTDALRNYYRPHTIYFWNADRDALIPDLRYLPVTVPVEGQATEVLDWLTTGPAEWLTPAAVGLPDGTARMGNVPAPKEGARLEVNLSIKPGAFDTDRDLNQLFTQIVWSLENRLLRGELELKIQNQSRKVANAREYRAANPAYRVAGPPARFGVLGGRIYPLLDPGGEQPVPIAPAANHDIAAASLSRDGDRIWAALVSTAGDGRRLLAGAGVSPVTEFTASAAFPSMGRPVWLKGADSDEPIGLVVAGGRLHRFSAGDATLVPVPLPEAPAAVTAVGAALDGHRIAFIAGGGLYVAAVSTDDGTVTVGPARQLTTSLQDLTAVDWYGENSLAVAGAPPGVTPTGRAAIFQVSVDGVQESEEVNEVGADVTQLATYPTNPVVSSPTSGVLYEANQVAYASGLPIVRDQIVAGPEELPDGSRSPTAPFFLY